MRPFDWVREIVDNIDDALPTSDTPIGDFEERIEEAEKEIEDAREEITEREEEENERNTIIDGDAT